LDFLSKEKLSLPSFLSAIQMCGQASKAAMQLLGGKELLLV